MNIFLAGATGVIGRPLLARLLTDGHSVTALTRSESSAERLRSQGAGAIVADVFDREAVRVAMIETQPEVVIHQLTSIPHAIDPRHFAEQFAQTNRLRIEGTQILMEAALAAGARQFIAQSVTLFYAPDTPGLATEDQPLYLDASDSFVSVVKAIDSLEHTVLNTPGITGTVLRYGHFYGPGTGYASDGSVTDSLRERKLPIIGGGNAVFSLIHVDDAADATVQAMNQNAAGIFNIVDDDPAPVHDLLPAMAAMLDAPKPMNLPQLVGRVAAGQFAVYFINQQRGASNRKARQQLGWQPRHASWREGLRRELVQTQESSAIG